MGEILHTIQHFFQHFWCCYWPSIKVMILPGMGIFGSLNIMWYKMKSYLK